MKPRLHYFDMLKGIAIFMVVMGHVLTMCVREIDRAAIFKFIGEVHMPLFFFISGWMAMRLGEGGNVATPSLLPRAKRLLLPMLGASTLWLYYFPLSGLESPLVSTWEGLWSNEWKNGYWFTLVLFEIFAVYAAITPLLSRCRNVWGGIAVTAAAWAVMLACQAIMPPMWVGISSLGLAATFFPIFMAGALAKKHKDGFGRICESSGAVTAALIVTALSPRLRMLALEIRLRKRIQPYRGPRHSPSVARRNSRRHRQTVERAGILSRTIRSGTPCRYVALHRHSQPQCVPPPLLFPVPSRRRTPGA